MEISISARSSLKPTLITYLVLLLAIKVIAFWEILLLALLCALNYVLCMAKWEISNFSFFQFGSLAIKVIAFWEILPLALLCTQKWCLMYGQKQNFYYFPHWFGALPVKAMAFSEISLISHQKSAICLKIAKLSL